MYIYIDSNRKPQLTSLYCLLNEYFLCNLSFFNTHTSKVKAFWSEKHTTIIPYNTCLDNAWMIGCIQLSFSQAAHSTSEPSTLGFATHYTPASACIPTLLSTSIMMLLLCLDLRLWLGHHLDAGVQLVAFRCIGGLQARTGQAGHESSAQRIAEQRRRKRRHNR